MFASTDATSTGALVSAIAAGILGIANMIRNRRTDKRDDMETIVEGFKVLVDAERALTDRQVAVLRNEIRELKDDAVELRRLHEDCEADRKQLLARLVE